MIIPGDDSSFDESSDYSEITSEGMIQRGNTWIRIQSTVLPLRETEKAYYGIIRVNEITNDGLENLYANSVKSWIPKSMVSNVWWICTKKFDETSKVSNDVFEKKKQQQHSLTEYDPYTSKTESEEFS